MTAALGFRYVVDNTADASGRVTTELRIVQASHMDRGDYICVAANAYGRDKATIHLLVQEPPDFPRNLHVAEQGSRSILLAWSSPATDRDTSHVSSPITNYIVQYKEAQGTNYPSSFLPFSVYARELRSLSIESREHLVAFLVSDTDPSTHWLPHRVSQVTGSDRIPSIAPKKLLFKSIITLFRELNDSERSEIENRLT